MAQAAMVAERGHLVKEMRARALAGICSLQQPTGKFFDSWLHAANAGPWLLIEAGQRPRWRSIMGFRRMAVLSFMMAWLAGCGGRSVTSSSGNQPPTGTPSTYNVSLVQAGTSGAVLGTLTVNAVADDGSAVVQLSGVAASSTFSIRFCPFPTGTATCTQVATLSSDAAGNGQTTFTFPLHGTFAGIFIGGRGSMDEFDGGFNIPATGLQYQAALEPAAAITGGPQPGIPVGNDPLKKGQVTMPGSTTVHVELSAAVGNGNYGLTFCRNGGGSSCFQVGSFSTDSSGNATVDLNFEQVFGLGTDIAGVFLLDRNAPSGSGSIEFVTAFRVP